jgi:hypothetical protein
VISSRGHCWASCSGQLLIPRDAPTLACTAKHLPRRVSSAPNRIVDAYTFLDEMVVEEPEGDQALLEVAFARPPSEPGLPTPDTRWLVRWSGLARTRRCATVARSLASQLLAG